MSVSVSKNPVNKGQLSTIKVSLSCGDKSRNNFEWLGS
ncbi:hypothetical protein ALNOE001_20040 [Candidatus Methanobinarius endosymbioticus]|uniref:Uncharacterized protein n=1 Tax=Candidatus Methanobinarius endosymbioticus TaxID=2006182 RepID=A0A366M9K2_9EURY|nr:hypothetical protein ALNOE001_20040 [Candidatus Methanobinarius endosymbioticus]